MQGQHNIALKNIFPIVLHTLIGDHLTHALRGLVFGSQFPNLTPNLSFDHNSCISSLNEHARTFLASTLQDLSNGILEAQFGVWFPFQPMI